MNAGSETSTKELTTLAEGFVAALEALPPGAPIADAVEAALDAVALLEDPARQSVFGGFSLCPADLYATFEFASQGWTRERYAEHVADLHDQLGPELGKFLRSELMLQRIADVARGFAVTLGREPNEYARHVQQQFMRRVAYSLMLEPEFTAAATVLAEQAPALLRQIEAARARHEQFASDERARMDREQRAAAEAKTRVENERREVVGRFFDARSQSIFTVDNQQFHGSALAAIARGHGGRNQDGNFSAVPIEQLEFVIRRVQASESVTVQL